jgi:hypothetical protein
MADRQYLTQEEEHRVREMAARDKSGLIATLLRDRDLAWRNAYESAGEVVQLKAEIKALGKAG